ELQDWKDKYNNLLLNNESEMNSQIIEENKNLKIENDKLENIIIELQSKQKEAVEIINNFTNNIKNEQQLLLDESIKYSNTVNELKKRLLNMENELNMLKNEDLKHLQFFEESE